MPLPESKAARIERANYEMGKILDERTGPDKAHPQPLKIEVYDWDKLNPKLISPSLKMSLRFVAEVETPTSFYAGQLLFAAERDGAVWLTRFIKEVWEPEEEQHGPVLYEAALRAGAVTKAEMLSKPQVYNPDFPIGRNYTSGQAATYGWAQELVTFYYYQAMKHSTEDPILQQVLGDLITQETFHHWIYSNAIQFATPEEIVYAMRRFMMPGHVTSPDLQRLSTRWAREFGFNAKSTMNTLASGIVEHAGYEGLGRIFTSEAIRNGLPQPLRPISSILDKVDHPRINYAEGRLAARLAGVKEKAA